MLLLLASVAAAAQAKLIIINANQPPAVVPYSSMARCERAKAILLQQSHDPMAGQVENLPNGGVMLHPPQQLKAYCIPA